VVVAGRRPKPLADLAGAHPDLKLHPMPADVSKVESVRELFDGAADAGAGTRDDRGLRSLCHRHSPGLDGSVRMVAYAKAGPVQSRMVRRPGAACQPAARWGATATCCNCGAKGAGIAMP
jgi:hypothetical protein